MTEGGELWEGMSTGETFKGIHRFAQKSLPLHL